VLKKIPEFYQDVILAYNNCKTIDSTLGCQPFEIITDVIWGNERYMYKGKCIYLKRWIDSNILYVRDIIGSDGKVCDTTTILAKLENKSNWISEYHLVKSACKIVEVKDLSQLVKHVNVKKINLNIYVKGTSHNILDKRCNFYYDVLRNYKFKYPYMQKVWCRQLELDSLNFQHTWQCIYNIKIQKMPLKKLAEFNYKLLNGTLPCGYMLNKWKPEISSNCNVCKEIENVQHMIYECEKVKDIWKVVGTSLKVNIR
jgi:hypothetical protein